MSLLALTKPNILARLENASLDLRFKLRGIQSVGDDIVLVIIDEKSIREIGRWPWPRNVQAQLIDHIADGNPSVIGLDIIYSEPETPPLSELLKNIYDTFLETTITNQTFQTYLSERLLAIDTDAQLANSFINAGNIVLAFPLIVPKSNSLPYQTKKLIEIPDYIKRHQFKLVRDLKQGESLKPHRAVSAHPPLQLFSEHATALGHAYSIPDPDGITRHEFLALNLGDGSYYPSFSLEIARTHLGISKNDMSLVLGKGVRIDDQVIPADQKAQMLINYAGPEGTFQSFSATDVLHSRIPIQSVTNKIVLVGTGALGTYDQKATPFSANVPGVEKNATVVENILHKSYIQRGLWAGPFSIASIVFLTILITYIALKAGPLQSLLLGTVTLSIFLALTYALFSWYGIWTDLVIPALTILITYMAITALRFMTVEKQKDQIRQLFTPYVGPQIVEALTTNPEQARLGLTQRRQLTMLFCDIVGFTSFCEKHTTEQVVSQINEYLGEMTEVIFRWNGTVVDFLGDEIYAFWGAPLNQPNHAELAIRCALHMRKRLSELQEKWVSEGKIPFDNGIGINTGDILVANIGAEGKRMKYAAVGDHVNLASRVAGLTRTFQVPIILSEYTTELAKELVAPTGHSSPYTRLGHVSLRMLSAVKVKGRDKPLAVYELRSLPEGEESRIEEHASGDVLEMKEK